jgi:hypothetical protein
MNERWESTVWLNLRIDHPADWELLAYGKDPARGRLSLADREGVRLELSWQGLDGTPDLRRMVGDYRARLDEQFPDARRSSADRPGWRGFHLQPETGPAQGRYLRHERGLDRALELVVIGNPELPADERLSRILDSVGEEAAAPDGARRWRCWGLEAWVPAGLALRRVTAQPANLELGFADARERESLAVARRGLLDVWMNEPVETWLQSKLPRRFRTDRTGLLAGTEGSGHPGHRISGSFRRRRGPFAGGWQRLITAAWICPMHHRLFTWERRSRQQEPVLPRVACCPAPALP